MNKTFLDIKIGDNFLVGVNVFRKISENSAKLIIFDGNDLKNVLSNKETILFSDALVTEINDKNKEILNKLQKIKNYLNDLYRISSSIYNDNIIEDISNLIDTDINSIKIKLNNKIEELQNNLKTI